MPGTIRKNKKKMYSPLSFLSVIINNSSLFLDAKTTTNRTTAQIMYSVKSSLSGGGGEGTAKMCTGVRQESTPTGRGSMSLRSMAGRKKNKCQRGKKKERKIQFVSHKSPIRGIRDPQMEDYNE